MHQNWPLGADLGGVKVKKIQISLADKVLIRRIIRRQVIQSD